MSAPTTGALLPNFAKVVECYDLAESPIDHFQCLLVSLLAIAGDDVRQDDIEVVVEEGLPNGGFDTNMGHHSAEMTGGAISALAR